MDAIAKPQNAKPQNAKPQNAKPSKLQREAPGLFSDGTEDPCTVTLEGLATAVPPFAMPQELVKAKAKEILGDRYEDFARLSSIMQNAGIKRRFLSRPPVWFEGDHDFHGRNNAYLEVATDLFKQASLAAMKNAGLEPHEIDCIVTVSSTGVATPTIDARAMQDIGFRADVSRVPVFGLGCAAGVTGTAIAAKLARAKPGSTVLMVAIELCSLSFNAKNPTKADFVATVLFGDGAAALCLRSQVGNCGTGITIGEGVEHLWQDTLDNMGWDVKAEGLGVILDKSIPNFVRDKYRDAAEEALKTAGLKSADIERFVCHPGSVKVIQAIETSLDLGNGALDHERHVMTNYGNMSAPTVLFVLERVLKDARPGQYMMASLGPGFTASFLPVKINA